MAVFLTRMELNLALLRVTGEVVIVLGSADS